MERQDTVPNNKQVALLDGYIEGQKAMAKRLYDEVICPMCYRLNPHHATMDNGAGCKSCEQKEEDCGGIS